MTDTFRESLANNQIIVGNPTTDNSTIHWLAWHLSGRREEITDNNESSRHQISKVTPAGKLRSQQQQQQQKQQQQQQQQRRRRRRHQNNDNDNKITMSTKERRSTRLHAMQSQTGPRGIGFALATVCLVGLLATSGSQAEDVSQKQQIDPRSTQPTLDRQLESPTASSSSASSSSSSAGAPDTSIPVKPQPAAVAPASETSSKQQHEPVRPSAVAAKPQKSGSFPIGSSRSKAAALAAQRDYDKYQLKASSSPSRAAAAESAAAAAAAGAASSADAQKQSDKDKDSKEKEKASGSNSIKHNNNNNNGQSSGNNKQSLEAGVSAGSLELSHKKVGQLPNTRPQPKPSAFSLLKRFLPSFMTSAAATAAAVSASAADKHPTGQNQHSRSSPSASSTLLSSLLSASSSASTSLLSASSASAAAGSSFAAAGQSALTSRSGSSNVGESNAAGSPLTGKIINLLTGAQKKKGLPEGLTQAIPNHAPFFMRKTAADRQAPGSGALALASGLLSNPLKLGLLFSAPLLPSLLLTPLAIAGLSPAMSAINNFFGDDDEPSSASSSSPAQSSLSALASGSSSPLASILQAAGASPFASSSDSSSSASGSSSGSSSGSGSGNSLALQAFQSFVLGPTSTTERPLFKPGVFASAGIQNAASAIGSAISGSSSSGQQSSSGSNTNPRPLFGSSGGLMQAAASMISPSFAAPPSSSSGSSGGGLGGAANDDDGPGLIQMASDVFEKVANYMGNDNTKDGQAIAQASSGPGAPANSPLSALAGLSSMSPFQLSSLFASSPIGTAIAGSQSSGSSSSAASGSSSPVGNKNQRAGFFSTLRNVYELFSSSFLRRQEVGNENECQQRLVCELHQRAMNSKLFRRSLQTSLSELANLDKNLIEQIKYGSQTIQARVDPDTKQMLNDFLKATNNFKSGREMINCSQMFPKCTRTQLLAAANAHLADPVNGRAIGKFSHLMKKMKFKSNQQSIGQWKLRKPGKSSLLTDATRTAAGATLASQPIDHMQVVPLQAQMPGQLTPADSLKLAQQIMMLSQMSQQQPQQQQPTSSPALTRYTSSAALPQVSQHWSNTQTSNGMRMSQMNYQQSQPAPISSQAQQQQPNYSASALNLPQYSPAPKLTTYTDAMLPSAYMPTESPYFMPQLTGNIGSQQPQVQSQPQQQQPLQQPQSQQQYVGNGNPFVDSSPPQTSQTTEANQQQSAINNNQQNSYSAPAVDQSMPQQQQPSLGLNMENKNKPQQLFTGNKMIPIAA